MVSIPVIQVYLKQQFTHVQNAAAMLQLWR